MTLKYEHTQKQGLPFWLAAVIAFFGLPTLFSNSVPVPMAIFFAGLLLWVLLMMSSLTVTIDDKYIRVRFGLGVFFKKFPLSEIVGCSDQYKTFCLGWGIRYYFGGWLYNIAGFKSVEIIFKNGKKARIGTDELEKLAGAIRDAINQTPKAAVL